MRFTSLSEAEQALPPSLRRDMATAFKHICATPTASTIHLPSATSAQPFHKAQRSTSMRVGHRLTDKFQISRVAPFNL